MRTDADGSRRYGVWGGNPTGFREDRTRCVEEIMPDDRGSVMLAHQCRNKRGHGPDGLYCRRHNPEAIAAKAADAESKEKAWEQEQDRRVAHATKLLDDIGVGGRCHFQHSYRGRGQFVESVVISFAECDKLIARLARLTARIPSED